jgi:hypothetical protein
MLFRKPPATSTLPRRPARHPPTWRCGHPRTAENSYGGTGRTHAQCWTCRRESQRRADARYEAKLGRLWRKMQKDQSRRRVWFRQHDAEWFARQGEEEPIRVAEVVPRRRQGEAAARVRVLERLTEGWPEAGAIADQPRRLGVTFARSGR